jgi:hypothetical protein
MQALTEKLLKSNLRDVFSDVDVANLLGEASDSKRYALVKRALAANEIVRIKRGLYILAEPFRRGKPDLFCLASRIYGPAYISLESALAAHGWIPERVVVVTSGVFKRSASFSTPLGRFEFSKTPFRSLSGVTRVAVAQDDAYLLASPQRALVDLVHDRRGMEMDRRYLISSLRIDPEFVDQLDTKTFDLLLDEVVRGPARRFLLALRRELGR